jgi:hypothetical protein
MFALSWGRTGVSSTAPAGLAQSRPAEDPAVVQDNTDLSKLFGRRVQIVGIALNDKDGAGVRAGAWYFLLDSPKTWSGLLTSGAPVRAEGVLDEEVFEPIPHSGSGLPPAQRIGRLYVLRDSQWEPVNAAPQEASPAAPPG